MDKPDVDLIQGIGPAMAIEQKTNTRNPRSTVGTVTEIYDYLRLLFARIGKTYCRKCGQLVRRDSVGSVIEDLNALEAGTRVHLEFPLHDHPGHTVEEELDNLRKRGFHRIVINAEVFDVNETIQIETEKRQIRVLVDRLVLRKNGDDRRLADSIETTFREGEGYAIVHDVANGKEWQFSQHFECAQCGIKYEEPEPRLFSFNNPYGACPNCQGFGRIIGIDMDLVIPDKTKSIRQGAIHPWTTPAHSKYLRQLLGIAWRTRLPVDIPFKDLQKDQVDLILSGHDRFKGINGFFKMLEEKSYKIHYRVLLSRYRGYTRCEMCHGSRLRPEVLNIRVGNRDNGKSRNINEIVKMSIWQANSFFDKIELDQIDYDISHRLLTELKKRLKYLVEVGLGYLTLDRVSGTLSGGESQRINLATSLGSSLVGSVYVLDEPTIGLHPRDNGRLINILRSLRDVGNTVIVVEHDAEMMRASDVIVDLGPRAGERGGEIVFQGTFDEILEAKNSLTGNYLSGTLKIDLPKSRRKASKKVIVVRGASENNLKNIDVKIPLNMFVCVTGVSGSGKSTLIHEILYAGLEKIKHGYRGNIGKFETIGGSDYVDAAELVDQSPIGRSPRSNPITYIKAFDLVRDIFANTQQAKIRGYKPGHFSFNVPGGRCETCEGEGFQKIEMQFLADLYLVCESCKGKRYKSDVLEVKYKGKTIDDVLNMSVNEAIFFFHNFPRLLTKLKTLDDVGLGYMRLGQPATTLSGGEAQRLKLASHLLAASPRADGKDQAHILFLFDEPTTGLHFDDIAKLLKCFNALIRAGHSVVIIEHNMDVIKCSDYVIDLGPDGGDDGGEVVAVGTPEEIARSRKSHTGKFLKHYLTR
jgi:excinuclease ABC subunit A